MPLSAQDTTTDCAAPASVTTNRPDPEGVPTPLAVGLYVIDVTEIDDVRQTFTADLHEAILTARLVRTGKEPLSKRIDRWLRVVYPALFVVILYVAFGK